MTANFIPNCPITLHDTKNTKFVWGPDLGSLKGKTTRQKSPQIRMENNSIPIQVMQQYKDVTLSADVMKVNGIPFLMIISRHITFGTAGKLDNMNNTHIIKHFKAVSGAYAPYNGGIQQALGYLAAVGFISPDDAAAEIAKRTISFSAGQNAVVIVDEDLTDLEALNPAFAGLKQYRHATADDLLLLASSTVIGTTVGGNPQLINGVTVPLADNWVLTPQEQMVIQVATDSYNATMATIAGSNPNIALFDFYNLGIEAVSGIVFDDYTMNGKLVTGGIFSLDGVHTTARGYALIANYVLAAMDSEFGSNFTSATNGLAKAGDYPTNYSAMLR